MMINKDLFKPEVAWNNKTRALLIFLVFIPNLLSFFNIITPLGVKFHLFQLGIILAASLFGPIGGGMAGAIGSAYSAFIMNNPYIIIGNVLLGFFCGYFMKRGMRLIYAVLVAFAIQVPYLIITDHFLMNMPMNAIMMIIAALLISNIIWAFVSGIAKKTVKPYLE